MLVIPARLGRSESFWAVAKVRSPHTGPGIRYIIKLKNSQNQPAREALRAADLMWGCVPTPILI